jgi:TetR/AcrR family acrAB operon transcriptional repressor
MVRKTREAALATREALIDAAEKVFRRDGVTRTSLAEVAAEAGMTRGAIYWHFRDKAELLAAMCDRTVLPIDAALARAGEQARDDPLGALRGFAVDALTRLATDGRTQAVFDILFHRCELVGELDERGRDQAQGRQHCLVSVEGLFALAIEKGQLPADADPSLAAHTMHAYVIGVMHEWVLDPGAYDLAGRAAAIIDLFLAGLRAEPPRRLAGEAKDRGAARVAPTDVSQDQLS